MEKQERCTLAGGCFWCTEAIFKRLKGVTRVTPGYTGGSVAYPNYEQVGSGTTGHAEAIDVEFDPQVISFETLLDVFFALHDPTTLNQQGADVGSQYRSAIFYHNEEQKKAAQQKIEQLNESKRYPNPVVTTLEGFTIFYPSENYHRDYYERNAGDSYCQIVIEPKVLKLFEEFRDLIKE